MEFPHLSILAAVLFFEFSLAALLCLMGFIIDKLRQIEGWNEHEELPRFLPARPWPNLVKARHAPVLVVISGDDRLAEEKNESSRSNATKKKKNSKKPKSNKEKKDNKDHPEDLYDPQFLRSPHLLGHILPTEDEKSFEMDSSTQNTNTVSERKKKGSIEKVHEKQKKKEAIKAVHYMESLLQPPVQ